ncbi:MAG: BACON domain-containing protein [Limisphaerales bacterium]
MHSIFNHASSPFVFRHPRCLRFCASFFIVLAWLAFGAAQAQATTYALGATTFLVGPAAGSNSVVLAVAPVTGTWTATTNATWLHLSTANQSGTGPTNVVFSYDANAGATRSGTLTIAGQTLTVTQAGSTYVAAGPLTTLVSSDLSSPYGVAVDGSSNVYIADTENNAIKKWTVANDTVTTLVSSNLSYPYGVAVDGSGNVYIADTLDAAIKEWMPANSNVITLVSSNLSYPYGVTVDGSCNVYIADAGDAAVKEWMPANSNVTTLISSGLTYPIGVAVDRATNIYIGDGIASAIKEWTAANSNLTTLVSSGLSYPAGAAVDGSGNLYIADPSQAAIMKWTAASRTLSTQVSSGLAYPNGVAVDGAGNLYITDTGSNSIVELPYAFVDPTDRSEASALGSDALPGVLPATENLLGPFAPASDQAWLTITGIANGVVSFSFAVNNTDNARTAHITLLGQVIEADPIL